MDDRDENVTQARRYVRRDLGSDLEQKASDEFCLAMAERLPTPPARRAAARDMFESLSGAPAPVRGAIVLEFDETLMSTTRARATGRLGGRQAAIEARRDACYVTVGSVYDEIERQAGGLFRAESEAVGMTHMPSLVTQVCWLNGTVRTWADPHTLSEIAAHGGLTRVDVPRRLMPDAGLSTVTIGAPAYRQSAKVSGEGVTVAVIDSEVALSHPALKGRVVHRRNYTSEPWGNPDSHGTAVAGIVASDDEHNAGVAPGATVYNYKVLATNRAANGDDFAGTIAVQQALEDGAEVANCSWGIGPAQSGKSREARAFDAAWALGLTIVKSAGNRGSGVTTITSPSDAEGVIAVGATDVAGTTVEDYSSRGPTPDGRHRPHLVAPGGNAAEPIVCCLVHGGFGAAGHGTSYAAPHVTGAVALLLAGADASLEPAALRDQLVGGCRLLPGFDVDDQGAGLLQLS